MAQIIPSWNWWGGGGGWSSYTAWNWIDITSNEISIDETVVQTVGNMVDNLTWADDDHYPTAKAVADAISWGWSWDVVWPASSTDEDVVVFDWVTWKIIKDSGVKLSSKLDASALSDNNYWWAWENDSTHTPTKRALYDKIHTMDVEIWNKAADTSVVKLTWNQTINGTKTFWTSPVVPSKTTDATNTWTAIATEAQVYNVEQKIPSVIDDLTSTSSTSALSANHGKVLDDKIAALFWLWKFLSLWDATTWQPISFPLQTPYTYTTWDYFLVETISSATPPVNYKPTGSSYTGTASSTAETEELEVWDIYIYDWTNWLLQLNHWKTVSFSEIAWQPTDNANLSTALSAKADDNAVVKLTGDQTIAWTKTFSTSPVVPNKTADATNTWTAIATEAQVYKKQDTLTTQTAYTTKWTATKVPTITTNTLWQVTAITETSITWLVPSGWSNWDVLTNVSWTPTWQAPSGWIENVTTGTTSTVTGIWAWSEAEYWNITPSWTVLYFTF